MISRRQMTAGVAAFVLAAAAGPAAAQAPKLPEGPIRLVAGFAAGGSSDVVSRLVAKHLEETLKKSVVVENKPGAGGRIAVQDMIKSPADGSTLLIANIVNALLIPLTFSDAKYHPLKDLTLVSRAVEYQMALATGPMTNAKNLKELTAWLKANPDKGTYGVPAAGSIPHMVGLEYTKRDSLDMRMLALKGGAPIANELISGSIPVGIAGPADLGALHKDGKLRIVAVSGAKRAPGFDDVPTFAEQGYQGFDSNGWIAFFAPPGMAPDVQKLLSEAINGALKSPETAGRLAGAGFIVTPGGPAELKAQIEKDEAYWTPRIAAAGVKK